MTKHNIASSGSAETFCHFLREIDFLKLPSVPFKNKANLPNETGVYFVIDSDDVLQYCGHSGSIRKRLANHSAFCLSSLKAKKSNLRIAFLLLPNKKSLARVYEAMVIDLYKPPMNLRNYPRLLERSSLLLESKLSFEDLKLNSEISSKLTLTLPITLSLEAWGILERLAKLNFDSIESYLEDLTLRDY